MTLVLLVLLVIAVTWNLVMTFALFGRVQKLEEEKQ